MQYNIIHKPGEHYPHQIRFSIMNLYLSIDIKMLEFKWEIEHTYNGILNNDGAHFKEKEDLDNCWEWINSLMVLNKLIQ